MVAWDRFMLVRALGEVEGVEARGWTDPQVLEPPCPCNLSRTLNNLPPLPTPSNPHPTP